ncbi:MAG: bifunctional anthranilate synthase component I family protein/class IV aminotransferase [Propionibacteriaceae bacterium]|nr:bifunctional anthranilate synthase component I family protein/class IV aminotransferase [Propionibacteriaceae bacterium]
MEPYEPFVLLDDAHTGEATLLTGLQRVDEVRFATIDGVLADGWQRGWHAFTWLPYSLGEAELGIRDGGPGAIFWFGHRSTDAETTWLKQSEGWLAGAEPDVTKDEFGAGIAQVHDAIAAGTTYQINYTHRVTARFAGDPVELYRRLRERQPVAYGVLAHLPAPAAPWTLSLSPELFVRVEGGVAITKPMKGTAPAHTDPAELSSDPKNRAENLMIVDLLRNDLSRVSKPGTVEVSGLFETERVGQLWQMTSTVRAELLPGTTPGGLLAATFPCGSITGAPKLASMALIRDVEHDPRGLYTGSLGLLEPDDSPLGWRGVLNIAIRTLEIDPAAPGRNARLGIGSGVVADSTADAEWEECRVKAGFARGVGPTVSLIETLRVIDGVAPLGARHQARLTSSAAALGFHGVAGDAVAKAVAALPPGDWRLRLQVSPSGVIDATHTPLDETSGPVRIVLCAEPWWQDRSLARHKTTHRAHFEDAYTEAQQQGAFDAIGWDVDGQVLEGTRTSVFALLDDGWVTPPLTLGVLDGVQRAAVLSDPALIGATEIREAAFTVEQLRQARRIVLTNAVRDILTATW